MNESYNRHIKFENVINFRDIGGYPARDGYTVAWRRIFRSGEFRHMTRNDLEKLTGEIGLTSVLDLRSGSELENGGKELLEGAEIRYRNIAFMTDDDPEANASHYAHCTNMGEFYLVMARQPGYGPRIVEALEVIADPANHPLVFNCAVGKDRTGMLAAVLLSVLGVKDEVIVEDYTLSGPYMEVLRNRITNDPQAPADVKNMPDFFWKASPESMSLFLSTIRNEYSSIVDYLKAQGADRSLVARLEKALLT
jgi:protein-tyrosine phosphatase